MKRQKNWRGKKIDLLVQLIRTNFKYRYNDSVLGFIWVLLKPLMTFIILYIVFSNFKTQDIPNFQLYLLIGIVIYYFFSESVLLGMNSLLEKAHIILKVNFPHNIAVTSSLIMAFINFLINLLIFFIFALFSGISFNLLGFLYFLFIIFVLTIFFYGFSYFMSILSLYLKDLKNIVEILLQLGFYAVPIFYPVELIPERFRPFIQYNPLTIIIQAARSALIYGRIEYTKHLIIILVSVSILAILGYFYFNRNVKRVTEYF